MKFNIETLKASKPDNFQQAEIVKTEDGWEPVSRRVPSRVPRPFNRLSGRLSRGG
jgi:hypothetical protein